MHLIITCRLTIPFSWKTCAPLLLICWWRFLMSVRTSFSTIFCLPATSRLVKTLFTSIYMSSLIALYRVYFNHYGLSLISLGLWLYVSDEYEPLSSYEMSSLSLFKLPISSRNYFCMFAFSHFVACLCTNLFCCIFPLIHIWVNFQSCSCCYFIHLFNYVFHNRRVFLYFKYSSRFLPWGFRISASYNRLKLDCEHGP